jgi:myo-inositol-1(or 4)-monophosphatase
LVNNNKSRAPGAGRDRWLPVAQALAVVAGEAGLCVLDRRRAMRHRPATRAKLPNEPVTRLDCEAENDIRRRLAKLDITDSCLGEEGGFLGPESNLYFVVDPIDGTTNFSAGFEIFGNAIALVDCGRPVAGACFDARTSDVYYAAPGAGAHSIRNGRLRRLRSGGGPLREFELLALQWPVSPRGAGPVIDALSRVHRKVRVLGSAVSQILSVSSGEFAACVLDRVKLWDIAAPALIASEVGAELFDFGGTTLLPFPDKGRDAACRDYAIVAARPGAARPLVGRLRSLHST